MAHSCNVVFAELAVELGSEIMTATAQKAGINDSFDVDGVKTAKGNYNVTDANTNQLAWSGVGQYSNKVNPMQMAVICGAIANSGKTVNPTLLKNSSLLESIGINSSIGSKELFSADTSKKLEDLMRYTITDYYGDYLYGGLSVCAKTGTAEVGDEKNPNAWIVGFSQDESCPLAFACVVEDSGFGSQYAAPVAQAAMIEAAKNFIQ